MEGKKRTLEIIILWKEKKVLLNMFLNDCNIRSGTFFKAPA
jgi:hypothetical protein